MRPSENVFMESEFLVFIYMLMYELRDLHNIHLCNLRMLQYELLNFLLDFVLFNESEFFERDLTTFLLRW